MNFKPCKGAGLRRFKNGGKEITLISDASRMLGVESHVLRYWEEELNIVIPRNEWGIDITPTIILIC